MKMMKKKKRNYIVLAEHVEVKCECMWFITSFFFDLLFGRNFCLGMNFLCMCVPLYSSHSSQPLSDVVCHKNQYGTMWMRALRMSAIFTLIHTHIHGHSFAHMVVCGIWYCTPETCRQRNKMLNTRLDSDFAVEYFAYRTYRVDGICEFYTGWRLNFLSSNVFANLILHVLQRRSECTMYHVCALMCVCICSLYSHCDYSSVRVRYNLCVYDVRINT